MTPNGSHDAGATRDPGPERRPFIVRRLAAEDAAAFHALRQEGFVRHPREFRIAPDDEAAFTPERVADRLAREFVVGGFAPDGALVGIGGLGRFSGAKLRHKALLWGMYVRDAARGQGLGDAIVEALLAHARAERIETVQLTVVADNPRARRVYERWGFRPYGLETGAVKVGEGPGRFTSTRCSWPCGSQTPRRPAPRRVPPSAGPRANGRTR